MVRDMVILQDGTEADTRPSLSVSNPELESEYFYCRIRCPQGLDEFSHPQRFLHVRGTRFVCGRIVE